MRVAVSTLLTSKKCKDFEEHAVLGRCYRINIRAVFSKTIEQLARKEVQELRSSRGETKRTPADDDQQDEDSSSPKGSTDKNGKGDKKKDNKKDNDNKQDKDNKKDKDSKKKKEEEEHQQLELELV